MNDNGQLCKWLDEFLNDELNEARRQAFERHTRHCQTCRQSIELERQLSKRLAERWPTGAPHEVVLAVDTTLVEVRRRQRVTWAMVGATSLAAFVLIAVVVGQAIRQPKLPGPGAELAQGRTPEETIKAEAEASATPKASNEKAPVARVKLIGDSRTDHVAVTQESDEGDFTFVMFYPTNRSGAKRDASNSSR